MGQRHAGAPPAHGRTARGRGRLSAQQHGQGGTARAARPAPPRARGRPVSAPPVAPGREAVEGRAWYALALLYVTYVVNIIDRHIINILVEPVQAELSLSDTQVGFVTGLAFA